MWHRFTRCSFKEFGFQLTFWHHFGLHQGVYGDDWRMGLTLEDRMEKLVLPQVKEYGKPDLLLFTSGTWDIQYLSTSLGSKNSERRKEMSPLTWSQLLWHRTRLEQAVNLVQASFPGVPILYRTTTEHRSNSAVVDYPVAVFQLNESSRALMKSLRIPLFHCECT